METSVGEEEKLGKLPKDPIWLIWVLHTNAGISLLGVYTNQGRANAIRKYLSDSRLDLVRVWVEKRETNHLYGSNIEGFIDPKLWREVYEEVFGKAEVYER